MNNVTKGALAAVAGVALLTGIGGTFAEWSASDSGDPGTITAGELDVTVAAGSWADVTDGTPEVINDISAWRMVPGDKLEYTTTVTPTVVGDNLTATLTATIPNESGTLADDVVTTAVFEGTASSSMQLDEGTATPFDITVTVEMPYANTAGETEVVDLSDLTVELDQNPNPVP